jgi:hypothetical protein
VIYHGRAIRVSASSVLKLVGLDAKTALLTLRNARGLVSSYAMFWCRKRWVCKWEIRKKSQTKPVVRANMRCFEQETVGLPMRLLLKLCEESCRMAVFQRFESTIECLSYLSLSLFS